MITADTVGDLSVAMSFAEGIVRSLGFSPDGTVLAAAEGDPAASIGTIQLYDSASGLPLRTLEGHESAVWGLAFSPDGRYLASADRNHTARVWDWVSGTLVKSLAFPNEVVSVAFSPDSRILAVGGVDESPGSPLQDAAIWTYTVDSWEPQLKLAEYWNILDIAFSPDGSTAATGLCVESDGPGQCIRGAVWLWSLTNRKLIETLSDFTAAVGEVAYSTDGSVLIAALTASPDGTLRAYSTSDSRPLLTTTAPPGPFQVEISDMALSADGGLLATGGSGGIDLWRVGG